jgi:anhydro-N-acetylmuramic acid kinase
MGIKVLGVMTGTSCDGLDAVCMTIHSDFSWKVHWKQSRPYPNLLRKRVLNLQDPDSEHSLRALLELHRDLGKWYGQSLRQIIQSHSKRPDVIANHGQTVAHFPQLKQGGSTLQLGNSSWIAVKTGLTVVSQFREGDLAAQGVGAPLTPLFHKLLARALEVDDQGVAFHNLGGISNLTYLHPSGDLLAFDTGPGNIWIDGVMERISHGKLKYDAKGRIASQGVPDFEAVKKILKYSYFCKPAPKSTGRDEFPFSLFEKSLSRRDKVLTNQAVATATEVTIQSIVQAYQNDILKKGYPLKSIYLCGGGAKNLAILNGIQARLSHVQVSSLESHGIDPQSVEAQAFAVLGYLSLLGQPLGGPWTGVKGFAPPGQITPGQNWRKLLKKMEKLEPSFHRSPLQK